MTKNTRPPCVAGMFYPGDPIELRQQITQYLNEVTYHHTQLPKVLIVPHAGYIYSGSVAASAFKSLLKYSDVINKVILLGPAHRAPLHGMAVPSVDQFQTPLGEINLDVKTLQALDEKFPLIKISDWAHQDEHSLEVQLPFLQTILTDFQLVPLVVGEAPKTELAEVIESLWGDKHCLIIISTDLSHFYSYEQAIKLDSLTASSIERLSPDDLLDHGACGRFPLRGLLHVAQKRKMRIERFDLKNSGDTAGNREQVVGYGAWGLFES